MKTLIRHPQTLTRLTRMGRTPLASRQASCRRPLSLSTLNTWRMVLSRTWRTTRRNYPSPRIHRRWWTRFVNSPNTNRRSNRANRETSCRQKVTCRPRKVTVGQLVLTPTTLVTQKARVNMLAPPRRGRISSLLYPLAPRKRKNGPLYTLRARTASTPLIRARPLKLFALAPLLTRTCILSRATTIKNGPWNPLASQVLSKYRLRPT